MGGSGRDRTDDSQKLCRSGLDRIQFLRIRIGLGLKNFTVHSSLMSTDQDWSKFWPDQGWIGLQFFWKLADQDWIGLRNFLLFQCDYSEHIKNFSCDSILQICKCIFCHQCQKLSRDFFTIRTASTFVHIHRWVL